MLMALKGTEVQYLINTSKGYPKMNFKTLIEKRYEDGDSSLQAPKIKDFVLIRKDGEETRIQKTYLLTNLENCVNFLRSTITVAK